MELIKLGGKISRWGENIKVGGNIKGDGEQNAGWRISSWAENIFYLIGQFVNFPVIQECIFIFCIVSERVLIHKF